MLRCRDLLLQQDDFQLEAHCDFACGGLTALIGPSGAGKSTFLSALAGFLQPVSGHIFWEDSVLNELAPGQRPSGILFQDNNLFPHLTIGQNVGLALRPSLRLSANDKKKVGDVLAKVGLGGQQDKRPSELSGGQQSRAALARLLLADRPLLLLDEPFAALGPALKEEMLNLVSDILVKQTRVVLLVTHDPNDALRAADHVALVAAGKVHPPKATQALFDDPPPALSAYLGPRQK